LIGEPSFKEEHNSNEKCRDVKGKIEDVELVLLVERPKVVATYEAA